MKRYEKNKTFIIRKLDHSSKAEHTEHTYRTHTLAPALHHKVQTPYTNINISERVKTHMK